MPSLTKTFINNLTPPDKGQTFHWDEQQRGLGLRVTPGSKSFVFQKRVNGKPVRTTIGPWPDWTVETARAEARRLAVSVDKGADPRQEKIKRQQEQITMGVAFERFLNDRELAPRTQSDYQYYVKRYFSDWLNKTMVAIDADTVARRYKKIAESSAGGSQASAAMRMLRSLFNFSMAVWEDTITSNPVDALRKRKLWLRENRKDDRLLPSQVAPWIEAVRGWNGPVMAGYVEFILLTGCRRSEASELLWKDVDLDRLILVFRDTKNGTDREIPIAPRCAELLAGIKPFRMTGSGLVFPSTNRKGEIVPTHWPAKLIAAANQAADAVVTTHGLRRTFTNILEAQDCPAYPLKRLLGHGSGGDVTAQHYLVHDVERLRPWMLKYESALLSM